MIVFGVLDELVDWFWPYAVMAGLIERWIPLESPFRHMVGGVTCDAPWRPWSAVDTVVVTVAAIVFCWWSSSIANERGSAR